MAAFGGFLQVDPAFNARPWIGLCLHLGAVWLAAETFERLLPMRAAQIASVSFALHPMQSETVATAVGMRVQLAVCATLLLLNAAARWKPRLASRPALPMAMAASFLVALAITGGFEVRGFGWLAQQGAGVLRSLSLFLVPVGFTVYPDLDAGPMALSLAWGVVAAVLVLAGTARPGAATGWWLVSAVVLMPATSWLLPSSAAGSDRAAYFAVFFLAGLVGILLQGVNARALLAFAFLLAALTVDRAKVWRTEQAIWMEASRLAPRATIPKLELARTLPRGQAVDLLESALEDDPSNDSIRVRLEALRASMAPGSSSSAK